MGSAVAAGRRSPWHKFRTCRSRWKYGSDANVASRLLAGRLIKWTAHAIPAEENLAGPLLLKAGAETLPGKPLTVTEDATVITIDTGAIQCRIHKSGGVLIDSITRDGKTLATNGNLVCHLRDSPDLENDGTFRQESFQSQISSVTVEQKGPVRAVIKIQGKHVSHEGRNQRRGMAPLCTAALLLRGRRRGAHPAHHHL